MEALAFLRGTDFAAAAGVAALAGFLRGFVGVGSGMLMAPVFAVLFGPLAAVGMVVLLDAAATLQLLPALWRRIAWREVLPMAAAAALAMPAGTRLLLAVEPRTMSRIIAALVLGFVLILAAGWRWRGPRNTGVRLGVGAVSGVLAAATGMGNPPVIVYFLSGAGEAADHRANFTGYFAVTLATLIAMMAARGLFEETTLLRATGLSPCFLLATGFGGRVFLRASERRYRQVALGLLFAAGLYGLLR